NRPTLHQEGHSCAMVSKTTFISRSEEGIPALIEMRTATAEPLLLVDENCQLTYGFFALNTGNVFSRWTFPRRFYRVAFCSNSDSAGSGRSAANQKISEMLRLARDQCKGALLSRRVNSCAEQERLSPSQAL